MGVAAELMGVSERHAWRLLAAYRKEGASAIAHDNRGRKPSTTTDTGTQQRIRELAEGPYAGLNHTHLTEMLLEREGDRYVTIYRQEDPAGRGRTESLASASLQKV